MSEEKVLKYEDYYKNVVREDNDDVAAIGAIANTEIFKRFNIDIPNEQMAIVVYSVVFGAIQDAILKQEEDKKSFKLNIADRLEMGFGTREDEEDEKVGNFMVYIKHIYNTKKSTVDSDETSSIVLCTQWNSENIIQQTKFISDVVIESKRRLKELRIPIDSEEIIMPIFITIHEQLIGYIQLKRAETKEFEYEINFASCFYVGARESAEEDDIYFRPNISSKLTFKNDQKGSSSHE